VPWSAYNFHEQINKCLLFKQEREREDTGHVRCISRVVDSSRANEAERNRSEMSSKWIGNLPPFQPVPISLSSIFVRFIYRLRKVSLPGDDEKVNKQQYFELTDRISSYNVAR
jgi:hypothetical protein